MAPPRSDLLSWEGSWHEIAKAIGNAVLDQDGTDEDVRRILKDKVLAKDIATRIIAARPGVTSEPAKPVRAPLIGRVVKTITIPAYEASSFVEAVRLGRFDNDTNDTVRHFADECVGLAQPTKVDMVEFDRDWWFDEVLAWGIENGGKKPIATAHTMGIAIGLPNEQRGRPIVGGSVRQGHVLYLVGDSRWRLLNRGAVEGGWCRHCLFGFLSE